MHWRTIEMKSAKGAEEVSSDKPLPRLGNDEVELETLLGPLLEKVQSPKAGHGRMRCMYIIRLS